MSAPEIEYIEEDAQYNIQLNQSDIIETEVTDLDDHWEHDSIKILLDAYLQNLDKFKNPKIKKKNIWVDIGVAVGRSPESCDRKYRNLKQSYLRVLKKKNQEGIGAVKWRYFDIFEEIYCSNGEYNPDIQDKIQDTSESVAKALLTLHTPVIDPSLSEGKSEAGKRLARKRHAEFKKVTTEMRDRQRAMEVKLERLISCVEESNEIQKERNRLFMEFLKKMNRSQS